MIGVLAMTVSTHFWLRLLILFLGLWGCGWLIGVVKKRRREKGQVIPIITTTYQRKEEVRTLMTNVTKIGLGIVLGMMLIDLWQYHHTYVVVNAVVDSQVGRDVAYHFENDPSRQTYAWHFCNDRYLPEFKPRQIVEKMQFVRSHDDTGECEDLSPNSTSLRLRRINGVPVLANQGE